MTDEIKFPNWWKVGRRASFVVCVGEAAEFDAWMEGAQGKSLARHLEKHTGWRLVRARDAVAAKPSQGAQTAGNARKGGRRGG
jgi:hypothetical protein